MSGKTIGIIVLVIVIVVLGAWFFRSGGNTAVAPGTGTGTQLEGSGGEPLPGGIGGDAAAPRVKEFAVSGSNFKFSMNEMRVKKSDTVRITFTNTEGVHDWKIDELKVATQILKTAGQSETVEFVATRTGTFEYYCSVGSHRQMGMKGMFIVE